jgi:molybdopterin adenylyltransferase
MILHFGIITISDRSSRGERPDASGPALEKIINSQGWVVARTSILPDDFLLIRDLLITWSDYGDLNVILTTGGTGFSPRDITPEATQAVIERIAPGIPEAMRAASMRMTPYAMLSRATAGIRKHTLIINLPGSPKAAIENLQVVIATLPHAIELLREDPHSELGHSLIP